MLPKPGKPVPFGRYLLVEKIASGGMAEVFRALLTGAAGFEKPVAVKRILPIFGEEPEFITLFQDEARIASTLTHPNIAQIFEFGEVEGAYYIALELVDGLDLARLMNRLRAAGQPMPLATAAFIIAEAARGLAYAHDKRGPDGRPIGIVHRDVSPPNILISTGGDVKVADFGIAKAANKVHKTETGVVMGKLRYMSPEQASAEELDARTDVYSLGVILYELLTGAPMYSGDQPLRLAELIRDTNPPPPSTKNAAVPPELDALVARALAKRREDRTASAAELARELGQFIVRTAPGFSREDLGALVRTLAPTRIEVDVSQPTEPALPPQAARRPEATPTRAESPTPRRRKRVSTELIVGLLLAVIILGSGAVVLARFLMPGHEARVPDAARLAVAAADAGPPPDAAPPSTAPFTLVASAGSAERTQLVAAVDRFDVTRRGLPTLDYTAFLTGLDSGLGLIVLDADGRAAPLPELPPTVAALVARAGVGDAVAATLEAVRQTGELPPLVKRAARDFVAGRAALAVEETVGQGGRVPPYAAAGLAVWLEPRNRRRLAELAQANDVLGRWCEPPPPPARHFAPALCERAALIAALRAGEPTDLVAEALERWQASSAEVTLGDVKLAVDRAAYGESAVPGEILLTVTLTAPVTGGVTLLAAGVAPIAGTADGAPAGGLVFRAPRRLFAPVLRIDGVAENTWLRLPPPPFGR